MKIINKIAAQGDVMFKRVDKLPEGLIEAQAENGKYIVAHSETGHCHVIEKSKNVQLLIDKTNEFIAYLNVQEGDAVLEHERSFDTHESIKFEPGIYQVRRQREYTPQGYRRAQD
jgi:hypothetical protein